MDFLDSLKEATRPDVAKRPWMNGRKMALVTESMLDDVIDECIAAKRYALDLETSGLDNRVFNGRTKHQIVGFCLSPNSQTGYYLPIRHKEGGEHNLSIPRATEAMRRLIEAEETVAIFHSAKFDCEFLQFANLGVWDDPRRFEDTLILAWLKNTRQKVKGLKYEAQLELGRDMIKLEELFPADYDGPLDFSLLDPSWEPCIWYASSDAICTYDLFDVLHPAVTEPNGDKRMGQTAVYEIEKLVVPATRWMERNRVFIDQGKVAELMRLGQQELFDCLNDIYTFCVNALGRDIRPTWFKLLSERFTADDPSYDIDKQIEDCRGAARRVAPDELDAKERFHRIEKTVRLEIEGEVEVFENFPERYDILSRPQLGELLCELEIPTLTRTGKSAQVKTTQDEIERLDESHGTQFPFLPKIKRLGELQKALGTYLVSLHRDVAEDGTLRIAYNQCGTDTGRYTTPTSEDPSADGGTKYPMHGTPATYDKKRPACLLRVRETIKARPGKIMVACVAAGSLVSTSRGLVPIETVHGGDEVLTDVGYKPVAWAAQTGVRSTLRLRTSKGFEIQVTDDHLIMTTSEEGFQWKPAGELKSGDWIVQVSGAPKGVRAKLPEIPWSEDPLARSHEKLFETPTRLDARVGLFFGWFLGDGSISHRGGRAVQVNFSLGDDVDDLLPKLNELAQELFGLEFRHRGRGDVGVASCPFARWMDVITAKGCTEVRDLRVPSIVLEGTPQVTAAFLRGLFDADGSVGSRGGDGIRLWITSPKMSAEVQLLLLQHGIQASRWREERETNFGPQEGWLVSITGIRNLERFRDRIGLVGSRKVGELEELLASGRNRDITEFIPLALAKKAVTRQRHAETNRLHTNGRRCGRVSHRLLRACLSAPDDVDLEWMELLLDGPMLFDTLERVEVDSTVPVYDIGVPDARRFQANGFLVHNCDYGGVELRIATILSGEPKWLNEYFRCSECKLEFDRGDGVETPEAPPGYCPRCGSDRIGDLHTLTGVTFYGEEAPAGKQWKQQRNNAKSANFSMAYGGGPSAIMRATGCDQMEAARHHRAFNESYSTLRSWWDRIKSFGRQHGYVATEFGRHYPIPDILLPTGAAEVREILNGDQSRAKFTYRIYEQLRRNFKIKTKKVSFEKFEYDADKRPEEMAARVVLNEYRADVRTGDKKAVEDADLKQRIVSSVRKAEEAVVKDQCERHRAFKAKAERNATNGPIQGLSADITKIAMALIYRECKKRNWLEKALLIITIHDELVFEIDEDILVEAIEVFQRIMARNKTILSKRWKVPLTTDCEIGFDWTVPWNLKDFKLGRVRPDGLEVTEKGLLPRDKDGSVKAKRWPDLFVKLFGPAYGFAAVRDNPSQEEGEKIFGPGWRPLPLSDAPTPPTAPLTTDVVVRPTPTPERPTPAPEQARSPQHGVEPRDPEDDPEAHEATPDTSEPSPVARAPEAPALAPTPSAGRVSTPFLPDEPLVLHIRELSVRSAEQIAHVIVQCSGRGTHPLKVIGPDGDSLLWDGAEILVNPIEFDLAMRFAAEKGRYR